MHIPQITAASIDKRQIIVVPDNKPSCDAKILANLASTATYIINQPVVAYCGTNNNQTIVQLAGIQVDSSCLPQIQGAMLKGCEQFYNLSANSNSTQSPASGLNSTIFNTASSSCFISTTTIIPTASLITNIPSNTAPLSRTSTPTAISSSSPYNNSASINNIPANLALTTIGLFFLKSLIGKFIY